MHNGIPTLVGFAAIALLAGVTLYYNRRRAGARRAQMASFGRSLGLAYSHRDHSRILRTSPQPLIADSQARRTRNVLSGAYRGYSLRAFDYDYALKKGPRYVQKITCVLVQTPMRCPLLVVRPIDASERLERSAGPGHLTFESGAFNRRFRVTCGEPKFAFDVVHTRAMAHLLDNRPLRIEAAGSTVLFCLNDRSSPLFIPGEMRLLLDAACDFMDLLPAYLLANRGAAPF